MPALNDTTYINAMNRACTEARAWLGATSPNPPVGAVALDANGKFLAAAAHERAGQAHAEAKLIELCRTQGLLPQVATLCVTLEPCNHHGRTPPCTEAIIAAGIKRVIIGTHDPNPKAAGGMERLQEAGVEVVCANDEECKQLIHAFAYTTQTGKPWITVKRAFNRERSMIPSPGQKTFTSKESLLLAHRLRKKADAIVTGSGTVLADAPLFTVRHTADHPGKRRHLAILDRRGRVPETYLKAAAARGLDAVIYKDIEQAFADLAARGAQDILVEAGPALSQSVLDSGVWTMVVDVHQDVPDRIETRFNKAAPVPFDTGKFCWNYILPL